jgi:hypothetical protein
MKTKTIGLLCAAITMTMTSCAGLISGITGTPIPAVAVQRVGQPDSLPVNIAASDYAAAEFAPEKIHGLYDAGAVASVASQAVDSGK